MTQSLFPIANTATITLTAKEAILLKGVAEDAFTVACAMSTHGEASSPGIQARASRRQTVT